MARPLTKTIKSTNIAIVKLTDGAGTHNIDYIFGETNEFRSDDGFNNSPISNGSGSTSDVSEPWDIVLSLPEKFTFKSIASVTGASAGAVADTQYSISTNSNNDKVVTFIEDAAGASGDIVIAEVVTLVWNAYDNTTLHATIFNVVSHSSASHSCDLEYRVIEGGTLVKMDGASNRPKMFSGDVLNGPFSTMKITDISNSANSVIIYYQEH